MRRTVALVVTAALAASMLALGAGPAAADPDDFGFQQILPGSGPAGTTIFPFPINQAAWDSYDPVTDRFSVPSEFEACVSSAGAYRIDLLDRFGARIVTSTFVPDIPAGTAPGDYSIFLGCFVDGRLRSACANFEVTAPGSAVGPTRSAVVGGPVISDPCPISLLTVVDRAFLRAYSGFGDLGSRLFPLLPLLSGPSLTTTTGPREQTSGTAPQPGGSGQTPPPAAGDTAGPTIGGVGVSPNPIAEAYNSEPTCSATGQPSIATVTVSVSDPSGVGSVTMSWPGGSKSMSGGGTRSATIGPFSTGLVPQGGSTVVTITVTATDGVGNVATRQGSVTVNDCTFV